MARSIVLALACLAVLLVATGVFFLSGSTAANTVNTVPTDYPTIQEAVDAANPGDTVRVLAGTYYEHVVANKSISLVGAGGNATIIDGNGTGNIVFLSANDTTVSGFTLMNGDTGVWIAGSNCTVENNIVTANARNYIGNGVFLNYSCNSRITGNIITDNGGGPPSLRWGEGILCYGGCNNTFADNSISDNVVTGIDVISDYNLVKRNNLTNNDYVGIESAGDYNIVIDNVAFANNLTGIHLFGASYNVVRNNSLSENGHWDIFGNAYGGGIRLGWSSANIIEENRIWDNVGFGIDLSDLNPDNVVRGNTVFDNPEGIYFHYSNGTTVYHNNFVNNSLNADVGDAYPDVEAWDNGAEGNYWSHLKGVDADLDGVLDAPYVLDSRNRDRYPLAEPWNETRVFSIPWGAATYDVATVCNFTVAGCVFNQPAKHISFNVTGPANTTSPFNVTIPISFMWGDFSV
ncbi:right-handed parallel beta-helix repeat-containing protein, partial [Candidatus Bathyarchaeota archaeon]|nr:right-handed parallel beta-helix repeat-containing protein [Candidatus Bathyarchaeota archaeon]